MNTALTAADLNTLVGDAVREISAARQAVRDAYRARLVGALVEHPDTGVACTVRAVHFDSDDIITLECAFSDGAGGTVVCEFVP